MQKHLSSPGRYAQSYHHKAVFSPDIYLELDCTNTIPTLQHCCTTPLIGSGWQLRLSLGKANIQHVIVNLGTTISTLDSGERASATCVTWQWRQPWSCTSLRKAKVRATPSPIQDSINNSARERKGSFWLPEKTFKEVGFLQHLLRSCVGLRYVLSICPSVFLSVKWTYLVFLTRLLGGFAN